MHPLPKFILAKNDPLHVSGSSSAHHQLPSWAGMELQFHRGPAWKLSSNPMTYTSTKCTVNGILMMGR
jgi:hypothetical protein